MNRRTFLEIGSSVFTLPLFMGAVNPHAKIKANPNDKAVVFLYLSGGPSTAELTHSNPEMLPEFRSTVGEIPTKTPGLWLGGTYKELAQRTDKINVVHSYKHTNANHQGATYYQNCGLNINTAEGVPNTEPCYGAMTAKYFGTNKENGMPNYVRTREIRGTDGGGWLGSRYTPFDANENGKKDLTLNIDAGRFNQRLRILKEIDDKNKVFNSNPTWKAAKDIRTQAVSMIMGDLKSAFDVTLEDEIHKERYGKSEIGNALLLAKRLVLNGVKYVNINYGGWDLHNQIQQGTERLALPLDKALSAFIDEIEILGLSEQVLLVVTGDFGRTKLNANAGRDHFPAQCVLMTYGGKYEKGRLIGTASKRDYSIESEPFTPKDLAYTIYDHLGIPKNLILTDISSRPRHIVENDARMIL